MKKKSKKLRTNLKSTNTFLKECSRRKNPVNKENLLYALAIAVVNGSEVSYNFAEFYNELGEKIDELPRSVFGKDRPYFKNQTRKRAWNLAKEIFTKKELDKLRNEILYNELPLAIEYNDINDDDADFIKHLVFDLPYEEKEQKTFYYR